MYSTPNTATQQEQLDDISHLETASLSGDSNAEHAYLQMPFMVSIDGRQYEGNGISLVNAFVTGLAAREYSGVSKLATFKFPFEGFTFTLQIEILMLCVDEKIGKYRLDFLKPTGSHLAHLRYVVNSYVAGELVTMNDLLSINEDKLQTGKKSAETGSHPLVRITKRIVGTAFVFAATLGLALFVGTLVQNRLFVFDVPALATIAPDGSAITAPKGGRLIFFNPAATFKEPLFAIQTIEGEQFTAINPCDCKLLISETVDVGEIVNEGTALAIVPSDRTEPLIKAQVPDKIAKSLIYGGVAEARMPDGRQIALSVTKAKPSASSATDAQTEITFASAEQAFTKEDIGKLVSLRVLSGHYFNITQYISDLYGQVRSKI
ncbi:hypothetical protein FDK21_09245 [Cohaesibacter sp. CAU 1516]|uniref:hypothetical protein n=1 Tax=Cohaesibacter sp. CAU 1516 TaxID=2576038 RepID=UPI0010FD363D|nr:hypothetical protein [Cohaesibacter sp. CAU 1516]TLP47171.1 hypothetical protein FDK21_09245 [Cohaesibacter sp. CAU 1516]